MTYMENIFICMASPLLIAALCMGKRHTGAFLFCLAGMGMCLLSAYLNTFFAALYGADAFAATVEIAPVVEEGMKLLPLLFYLLVFEPQARQIGIAAVITALSFATFDSKRSRAFLLYFLPWHRNGSNACDLRSHRRRRACVCVAADMAENCRNLRTAWGGDYLSCNL